MVFYSITSVEKQETQLITSVEIYLTHQVSQIATAVLVL